MKTIRCPQCNLADWENVAVCKRCKYEFQTVEQDEIPSEEPLESPYQREGSEFQQQQILQTHSPEAEPNQIKQPEFPAETIPPVQESTEAIAPGQEESFGQNQQANQQIPPQQNLQTNYQILPAQQQEYQPRYAYSNPNSKPKIKLAVMSMIFGVLGMPFVSMFWGLILVAILGLIFGSGGMIFGGVVVLLAIPAGLVFGIPALIKSNRNPAEYGGKGLAIAGIICSSIGILFLPIVAAIAVPNLLAARKAANEGSAISSIRAISKGQEYWRDYRSGLCGDLNELKEANLIDEQLAEGQKNGYQFVISKLPQEGGGCEITATPLSTFDGNRSIFYSTQDHVIRAANKDGNLADINDPPLDVDYGNQPTKVASTEDYGY